MPNLIAERVELARMGKNELVITKLESGWVEIGQVQPLEGYCLLLADPCVNGVNALTDTERAQFCVDMIRVGDAVMEATEAYRINYEILGNAEPALHAHIIPRYLAEPEDKRRLPAFCKYDWGSARKFDPDRDQKFVQTMRSLLSRFAAK